MEPATLPLAGAVVWGQPPESLLMSAINVNTMAVSQLESVDPSSSLQEEF